ncbi:MAG: beta-ketoacyl-[acyl-carrier-protein] synthase family protein [Propionibacteriaceae bacterium]|nr:beta-ketoacyl-[acyl-carrier-protein] synthase family protein [Propionibacteriaceae bacterium]
MSSTVNDVVVTGVGLLTSVGANAEESWANIQRGLCGIEDVSIIHTESLITRVGAQVRSVALADDVPADDTPQAEAVVIDRCHELAWHGAQEALDNAGLGDPAARPYSAERSGLVLGTLLGGVRRAEVFQRQWLHRGLMEANARLLWQNPPFSVADYVARRCGLKGPRTVPSNACAASAVAIAYGLELMLDDKADLVLVGGADPLAYLAFGGFSALESLDQRPCSPYSRSAGLTLGEGSGFLVLERRAAALARGAEPLAVVAGYGLSADAHHATAPDPGGQGAVRAIRAALDMSGLTPDDIGYINGHGTGTPANDTVEPRAMRAVFSQLPPISSTKSMIGHTLGAAGAVEAVVTVLGLRDQLLPPTVLPPDASPQEGLDIVPNLARPQDYKAALSTSFAFGGNNAALILTRPDVTPAPLPALRPVVVTGYGAITGRAGSAEQIRQALVTGERIYSDQFIQPGDMSRFAVVDMPAKNLQRGINPQYVRKMDALSRLAELATAELLKGRGLSFEETTGTGLMFATGSGPIKSVEVFQKGLIETGAGNAKYFPNTVMNAPSGHVAVLHQLKGPTATLCAGGTGAFAALWLAQRMIARGQADRVVVAASDEIDEVLTYAYGVLPGYLSTSDSRPFQGSGRVLGAGGAAVLLEAAEVAPADKVLGRIDGFGFAGDTPGLGRVGRDETPWARSFELALAEAGHGVDAVISAATGRPQIDDVEASAIVRSGLDGKPVFTPKALLGDVSSVTPLLSLMEALWLTRADQVTADQFGFCDRFGPLAGRPDSCLVSSFEFGAHFSAIVVNAA